MVEAVVRIAPMSPRGTLVVLILSRPTLLDVIAWNLNIGVLIHLIGVTLGVTLKSRPLYLFLFFSVYFDLLYKTPLLIA